ncbi:MAG TPA: hypothetical protein VKB38_01240 [Terracidiphilus sp.]|nr:hypothetical protein [Terracidiphilus sp.]
MKNMIEASRQILIAVTVLMAAQLSAQTWTAPVALSTGGQGWEAAAAIDGDGNSLALWDERTTQDQLWSRSKAVGTNWGPATTNVSPALQTTSVFPVVRITTAGFATAVWTDSSGIWTADRPAASSWESPQLLVRGAASPIFVMNSRGDAAVAWIVGGGPRSTTGSVMAVLRRAGGAWTSPQVVASNAHIIADHAGIGDSGDVVVTWETYTAVCRRYGCGTSNYVLHASRQSAGTDAWADSGALMGPDRSAHDARVALDSAGGAILVAVNSAFVYVSSTQGNSGGAWSAFKTALNSQSTILISNLASDDAGQVTLVYESISYPTSQAFAVNGNINGNTWSSPLVLSGSDTSVSQVIFAAAPSGAAVAIWLSSSGTPVIRAATRATAAGSWSAPVSIPGPGNSISPEAAAVESSGNAIAIYSGYDASSVHTEYVTSHQP